ncbi:MAG: hypothetical protein QOE47_2771, partial [Pyrinomonadaceae bacterium]|nr:hypothetical protein [Pyrinomonadaceae bacterium]
RTGAQPAHGPERNIRGFKSRAPRPDEGDAKVKPIQQRKRATR